MEEEAPCIKLLPGITDAGSAELELEQPIQLELTQKGHHGKLVFEVNQFGIPI